MRNPHSSECGSSRENKNRGVHAPLNPGKKIHKDMKHIVPAIAVATVLTLGAWTTVSAEEENEQTVKMSDLPAAAQTTIKDKAGSNEIVKIEKKTEEGKTVYEAVVNKKRHRVEHRSGCERQVPEAVQGERGKGKGRKEVMRSKLGRIREVPARLREAAKRFQHTPQ